MILCLQILGNRTRLIVWSILVLERVFQSPSADEECWLFERRTLVQPCKHCDKQPNSSCLLDSSQQYP